MKLNEQFSYVSMLSDEDFHPIEPKTPTLDLSEVTDPGLLAQSRSHDVLFIRAS